MFVLIVSSAHCCLAESINLKPLRQEFTAAVLRARMIQTATVHNSATTPAVTIVIMIFLFMLLLEADTICGLHLQSR